MALAACLTAGQSSTDACTGQDFVQQLSSRKQVSIPENFACKLQRIRPSFCHTVRPWSTEGLELRG